MKPEIEKIRGGAGVVRVAGALGEVVGAAVGEKRQEKEEQEKQEKGAEAEKKSKRKSKSRKKNKSGKKSKINRKRKTSNSKRTGAEVKSSLITNIKINTKPINHPYPYHTKL